MASTHLPSPRIVGEGARDTWDPCLLAAMLMGLGRALRWEGRHHPPLIQALGEAEPPNPTPIGTTGPAGPRAALAKGIILGAPNAFFPCSLFLPVQELSNLTSSPISGCGSSSFCPWDAPPVKAGVHIFPQGLWGCAAQRTRRAKG